MTDQTFDLSQEDYDSLIQQILTQEEQSKEVISTETKVETGCINFLQVKQNNASPTTSNESDYTSEYSSSELEPEDKENIVSSFFSGSEETTPPPLELTNCTIGAAFGTRRKPEMTFLLSLKNLKSDSIFPFDQSCTVELNSEEITTRYNPNKQKKKNKRPFAGYFIHVRVYTYLMTKDNSIENYYLAHLKTVNPFPLEFVNPRDKFVTIKEGQVKIRIRENITMKHLMTIDNIRQPTQLYIQFSLTYNGDLLCETPHCPISFTVTKKKKLVETTDIIFSPSKIPQSVASMIALQQGQQMQNEPSSKRLKIEQSISNSSSNSSNPNSPTQSPPPTNTSNVTNNTAMTGDCKQNMFPTSAAIWSSNSPVDIINYLEAQMMNVNGNIGGVTTKLVQQQTTNVKGTTTQGAATQYGNIINPTMMPVVMLVPTSYVTSNGTQAVAMTPVQVQTTPTQIVTINGSHHLVTQQPIKQYCGNGQYAMMGTQQLVALPGSPSVSPRKGVRYQQRTELETVTDSYSNIHMLQLPILSSNNSGKVPSPTLLNTSSITPNCKQVVDLDTKENSPINFSEKIPTTVSCCVDETATQNGNSQLDGWIDNLLS